MVEPFSNTETSIVTPTNERQIRPLTTLKDPADQREAWKLATENNFFPAWIETAPLTVNSYLL